MKMKTQNIFYLIGVLAVILFIAFFLGNVKMNEGFSTTPDNVKIASDAIQKSSAEQKAQIANIVASASTSGQITTRAPGITTGSANALTKDNFDWKAYVSKYSDLQKANIDNLDKAWSHYINAGKKENRIATIISGKTTTRAPTAAQTTTRAPTAVQTTTRAPTAGKTTTRAPTAVQTTTRAPTAAQTTTRAPTAASKDISITNLDKQKLNELSKRYINQSTHINNVINDDINFKSKIDTILRNTQNINNELIDIKEAVLERNK
jgi:hypothetical protein